MVNADLPFTRGNWQYVAGVGNDPRETRVFNPIKQVILSQHLLEFPACNELDHH